jgi:1-Cys peroxiredoxin 6
MPLNLGDKIQDFTSDSSQGKLSFYDYVGDRAWAILCSHPNDFTPVCSTELGTLQRMLHKFEKRNCKVLALSCDSSAAHRRWIEDINESGYCGKGSSGVSYPILADEERALAVKFGMLDPHEKDEKGMPTTCRAVFVIDCEKVLRATILYPASTGRNFYEILRVIDSLQLTDEYPVATPADWERGEKVMVTPSTPDEVAQVVLGKFDVIEVPSKKKYLRLVHDPSHKTPRAAKKTFWEYVLGDNIGLDKKANYVRLGASFVSGFLFRSIFFQTTNKKEKSRNK